MLEECFCVLIRKSLCNLNDQFANYVDVLAHTLLLLWTNIKSISRLFVLWLLVLNNLVP